MTKKIIIFLLSSLVGMSYFDVNAVENFASTDSKIGISNGVNITVVYNNVASNKNLTTDWGISCLIEGLEKTILFDTGGDGSILLSNMQKLKIDPKNIDIVVLSHIHADHVGGLWSVLEKNNKVTVYLPNSFPKNFKNRVRKMARQVISVDNPIKICKDVWSTGQLGTLIKEQALVIDTQKGLIVITGCAHPGVVNIVKKAKQILKKKVFLFAGGFHLMSYNENQVETIIRQLKQIGVEKVGPSHCTGERAIELFKEAWGENFLDFGCGARIEISAKREF